MSGTSMATSCAPLTAAAGSSTFRPSFLALFQLSPLRTPTTTSIAAVVQIERVRAALAAVAQNGDARTAQGFLIDVFLRIQTHGVLRESSRK